MMRCAAFALGIIEPDGIDPFLLMQVCAAVLLEKPLILLANRGVWIPAKARELADAVVGGGLPEILPCEQVFAERRSAGVRVSLYLTATWRALIGSRRSKMELDYVFGRDTITFSWRRGAAATGGWIQFEDKTP
jgi:hypothetical protein